MEHPSQETLCDVNNTLSPEDAYCWRKYGTIISRNALWRKQHFKSWKTPIAGGNKEHPSQETLCDINNTLSPEDAYCWRKYGTIISRTLIPRRCPFRDEMWNKHVKKHSIRNIVDSLTEIHFFFA